MKTMNMPGFTAEGSLYKTRKHYQLKGNATNNFSEGNALVYPQRFSSCGACTCDPGQCCENGASGCACYNCSSGVPRFDTAF
jgi:hypothetical protein